jgi:hypothetical protein
MSFLFRIGISLLINFVAGLFKTPEPGPKAATLQDMKVPVAESGTEIGVAYGCPWIRAPKVVWFGHLRTIPIKSSGGKK